MVITLLLFLLTLLGVLTRPFRIGEAWFAACGAFLMILFGRVSLIETWQMTRESGDVLLFLLFLMAFSALVDTSGFFDWAATFAARAAKGNAHRLLSLLFVLGAVITIVLSLDTTALLLTPLVYAVVSRANLPPKPYLFACAFVANIASSALPVSNLTNLLAFAATGDTPARYAAVMTLPTLLASLTTLGILFALFRKELPATFDSAAFPDPLDAVPHLPYFRMTLIALGLTLVGYFAVPALLHGPVWTVAAFGTVLLLVTGKRFGRIKVRTVALRGVAWSVFPFVIGMFVVIRGLTNLGLSEVLRSVLAVTHGNMGATIFLSAWGSAVGANIINNIPMCLLAVNTVKGTGSAPLYAAILGVNLGPNITVVGSLATLLWRTTLEQRGVSISPVELAKAGLAVTIPALLIACLALWLILSLP